MITKEQFESIGFKYLGKDIWSGDKYSIPDAPKPDGYWSDMEEKFELSYDDRRGGLNIYSLTSGGFANAENEKCNLFIGHITDFKELLVLLRQVNIQILNDKT